MVSRGPSGLGRQLELPTPWLTERHGYDPTCRPHQIRVQLSGVGCPIYGDQKYGQHITKKKAQIALWSYYLGFKHPTQDKRITVISEPPNEYPWTLFSQTIEAHKEI